MAVYVHIKTHVRVSAAALASNRAELERALTAAAGRAFGKSREVVLAGAGDEAAIRLNAPIITWTGAGAPDVPPALRAEVEEGIAAALARALSASGQPLEARPPGPPPKPARRRPANRDAVGEPFDEARYDPISQTYTIPSYQGKAPPKKVPARKGKATETPEETRTLVRFTTLEQVRDSINQAYKKVSPEGNVYLGVYGLWSPEGAGETPMLFWITGEVAEGISKGMLGFSMMPLITGHIKGGKFVSTASAMGVKLGAKYRIEGLWESKVQEGVPYSVTLRNEAESGPRPVFLSAADNARLRGKIVRFWVPSEVVPPAEEIVVHGATGSWAWPRARRLTWSQQYYETEWGMWVLEYGEARALPWETGEGYSRALWIWFGRLDIRVKEIRDNKHVQQVLATWEVEGKGFNWLVIYQLQMDFYKDFCVQIALEMLAISRKNMQDFIAAINADRAKWAKKLADVFEDMGEASIALSDLEDEKARLEAALKPIMRRFGHEMYEVPPPHAAENQAALDKVNEQFENRKEEFKDTRLDLEMYEAVEPLLVVLTLRGERTDVTAEAAVAKFARIMKASKGNADEAVAYALDQLTWLIGKNDDVRREMLKETGSVYKLQFVQQVADVQLKPWYDDDPFFKGSIDKLKAGMGLLEMFGLAAALLVLTFLFPPAGAAIITLTVGAAFAYSSVSEAVHLYRMKNARLAQYRFQPLVSKGEVDAAIIQATIDVVFVLVDIKGLGKAFEQTAARRAAGALAASLEESLHGWRRFGEWPAELVAKIRNTIREEVEKARPGWLAKMGEKESAEALDRMTEAAQKVMLGKYERRLVIFQKMFEQVISERGGRMAGTELRQWLRKNFPRPADVFEELRKAEVKQGEELLERIIERERAGLPPVAGEEAADFLGKMSVSEFEQFMKDLGPLAEMLGPERLRLFRNKLGLAALDYPALAGRLRRILTNIDNPEAVLNQLETLLENQSNALEFLDALGELPNPGDVLRVEGLTSEVVGSALPGGMPNLFEALLSKTRPGRSVVRVLTKLDEQGVRRIFREIKDTTTGASTYQVWKGAKQGWKEVAPEVAGVETKAALRTVESITEAERTAELEALELLGETRTLGRLTASAKRIAKTLEAIDKSPAAKAIREAIANVSAREGKATAAKILDRLGHIMTGGEADGRILGGVADFLKHGEGESLGLLLSKASGGGSARAAVVKLLEEAGRFGEGEMRGLAAVLKLGGAGGAEDVLRIVDNVPGGFRSIFGAVNDLAGHEAVLGKALALLKLGKGDEGRILGGVAKFLKVGDDQTLVVLLTEAQGRGRVRAGFLKLMDEIGQFSRDDVKGIKVVLEELGQGGADAVLEISQHFTPVRSIFGALNDLAPRSTGLRKVITYLKSSGISLNQAAAGQLLAARRLLEEYPNARLVFERAVFENEGTLLVREIDVTVVSEAGEAILEVELKEVRSLFVFGKTHTFKQFLRDVVRSTRAAKPGERLLGRIRWMVRETELIADRAKKLVGEGVAEPAAQQRARDELKIKLRDKLLKAFDDPDLMGQYGEFRSADRGLTEAQWQAARKEFEADYGTILKPF